MGVGRWSAEGDRWMEVGGWRLVGTAQVQAEREGGESLPLGAVRREDDAQLFIQNSNLEPKSSSAIQDQCSTTF